MAKLQKNENKTVSEQRTAFDRAVDSILDYIRTEKLKSGDQLPPAEVFCERYGFSRVIFREAMSYLKGLGVVESGRGRGMRLCELDPLDNFSRLLPIFFSISKSYNTFHQLRGALELGTFPSICNLMTDEDLEYLEKLLRKGDELLKKKDVICSEYNEIDHGFHKYLCRLSGNRLLETVSAFYRELFATMDGENDIARPEDMFDFRQSQVGHWALLNCMKIHCVEAGLMLMWNHVYNTKKRIYDYEQVKKREADSSHHN